MRGWGEPLTAEAWPLPSSFAEARRARSRGRTAALGEGPADQPGHLLCGVGAVAKLEGQGGLARCSGGAPARPPPTARPGRPRPRTRPDRRQGTSTPVLEAGPYECHCPTPRPPSLSSRSCAGRHAAALPSCRPLTQHLVLSARWARSLERPLQIVQGVVDAVQGEPGSVRAARASSPSHRWSIALPSSASSSGVGVQQQRRPTLDLLHVIADPAVISAATWSMASSPNRCVALGDHLVLRRCPSSAGIGR